MELILGTLLRLDVAEAALLNCRNPAAGSEFIAEGNEFMMTLLVERMQQAADRIEFMERRLAKRTDSLRGAFNMIRKSRDRVSELRAAINFSADELFKEPISARQIDVLHELQEVANYEQKKLKLIKPGFNHPDELLSDDAREKLYAHLKENADKRRRAERQGANIWFN